MELFTRVRKTLNTLFAETETTDIDEIEIALNDYVESERPMFVLKAENAEYKAIVEDLKATIEDLKSQINEVESEAKNEETISTP